jgi:MFS superfamily sulfate permease-like transporter
VAPGVRTAPGLVVYRFGTGLYFANADRLAEDVHTLARDADTDDLRWFCLDAAAIGDVDYSSAGVLVRVQQRLSAQGCRLVFSGVHNHVRRQLRDYGVARDGDVFYATAGEAYEHLGADGRVGGDDHSVSWPAEPPPEAPVPPGSASAR